MRAAGLVVAHGLAAMTDAVRPGVTTADLDAVAREVLAAAGATSSFLGYHGFPAVICASVDDEVVHGIPSPRRRLADGSVVSLDFGAVVDGWHGDAAVTVRVGDVPAAVDALVDATRQALWAALAVCRPGARLGGLAAAVQGVARTAGLGVVEGYTGHGIGRAMHEEPAVPNTGRAGRGPVLQVGSTIAVEPMVTLGRADVAELDDGWTVVTGDGLPAAHWEHTVAVTEDGPWVLTAPDGGTAGLASARAAARVA